MYFLVAGSNNTFSDSVNVCKITIMTWNLVRVTILTYCSANDISNYFYPNYVLYRSNSKRHSFVQKASNHSKHIAKLS